MTTPLLLLLPAHIPTRITQIGALVSTRNRRRGRVHRVLSDGRIRVLVEVGLRFKVPEIYSQADLEMLNSVEEKAA